MNNTHKHLAFTIRGGFVDSSIGYIDMLVIAMRRATRVEIKDGDVADAMRRSADAAFKHLGGENADAELIASDIARRAREAEEALRSMKERFEHYKTKEATHG